MPGVTKHIYEHELRDIQKMLCNMVNGIRDVLPPNYEFQNIVIALKKFYPHEWDSITYKQQYYACKDKYIKKYYGKARYNMQTPEKILLSNKVYRIIIEPTYIKNYSINYNDTDVEHKIEQLWKKRKDKIEKINYKIKVAKSKTQQVTPDFLDQLIGLYNRKNTSQMDRMYIIIELQKYYNSKIINFFFKLNDTELNKQLREIAFLHLQSFDYHPRLRRQKYMRIHSSNKKRKKYLRDIYSRETYTIPKNPEELEYRINNSKDQKIKNYDYFISHSSKDREAVQKLIIYQNQHYKNVFCDWINDVDYLKRHLLCNATISVLENRMIQSQAMIFVVSENSLNSIWCKYELNYFYEMKRPIYYINKDEINTGIFNIQELKDNWFLDRDYKKLILMEAKRIIPPVLLSSN